jgi:ketosteroid isomerase-like protein
VSEQNIEVIRQAFDAYVRDDIGAVLALCAEDIHIVQAPEVVSTGVAPEQHGHDGVLEAFGIWPDQWDDYEVELVDVVADPGDHVVVLTRQRGRGKQSGVEVEADFYFSFAVRGGKIAEWRIFVDEAQALATAATDPSVDE